MENLESNQPNQRSGALRLCIILGLAALFLTILLCGLGSVSTTHADPGTLYVDGASGQDNGTCGTTGSPCKTISHTLNSRASAGDTIRVAQGVYTENLTVDKQVTLEGGYEAVGWTRNITQYETIIDGSNSRTVAGDWDGSQVRQVTVLSDGIEYKMWFDGVNLLGEHQIGLATSDDGISWTKHLANPVLTGTIGTWDESGEHAPFVIEEGGIYKMWYEGSDGDVRRLGYATSTNGIDWNKHIANPILTPGPGGYDEEFVGHASLLDDGGTYKLWYHADGDQGCLIAYATSPDGITNWARSGPVLIPQPGSWDEDCVWGPSVLKIDGVYWMWYSSWGDQGGAIGVVTSTDGISWNRFLASPALTDTTSIGDPHVISESSKLKMWYQDWDEGTINYAESNDGVSWTKSPSNPVLMPGTSGQWGQPVVAFTSGSDGSVLDGFTVQNGEAERGGGILIHDTEVAIRNCTVVSNTAYEMGAGVMVAWGSKAVIQSNTILSNTSHDWFGSGLGIVLAEVLVDSNLIAYNVNDTVEHGSGAIGVAMDGPSQPVTITNNIVTSNTDKGIMVSDGVFDLQIVNNTVASNRNEGILAWGTITVSLLRNNIIISNGYCGIAAAAGAEFQVVDHNNVWQNGGGSGNYCDYGGAVNPPAPGPGGISSDPLFVDAANGNYHLQVGSPCIDAGTSDGAPDTDFDGMPRDAMPDIGAYEWGKYRIFLPLTLRNSGQ